jgi:hypothetical protein
MIAGSLKLHALCHRNFAKGEPLWPKGGLCSQSHDDDTLDGRNGRRTNTLEGELELGADPGTERIVCNLQKVG